MHKKTNTVHFIDSLIGISGKKHVLTGPRKTARYTRGYRTGSGHVRAVVRPASLAELWQVLKLCVSENKIILMQAANTGLTGGSTPDGKGYDRDIILINTMRMDKVSLLQGGRQVLCYPGATLYNLERVLKPLGRDPHSVIGSSCIGASVIGGICNNSGGALIQRGPAYTELSLFAQVNKNGQLELVNHLGIELGDTPEDILQRLDNGNIPPAAIKDENKNASDPDYEIHVRQVDAETPARFNADARRLYESSGSAGKLAVFAVRLDTFPAEQQKTLFYIGTNDTDDLSGIRRDILKDFKSLPVSAEYMHKNAYDLSARYGKDTFLAIYYLGTDFLPKLFSFKNQLDHFFNKIDFSKGSDIFLQKLSSLFPAHLPSRMQDYRKHYDHYLMLEIEGSDHAADMQRYLTKIFQDRKGAFFECTPKEARKALLHRFVVAGAGVRYVNVHAEKVEKEMLALDIALRRNDPEWFEKLPDDIEDAIEEKIYYGHFFCHVFHQDYILKKGIDKNKIKKHMLEILDQRGAEYPAEHNVGHVYEAKPALREFYRRLDPTNSFNPGIGKTSKRRNWRA